MRNGDKWKETLLLLAAGLLFSTWIGLKLAPGLSEGLPGLIRQMNDLDRAPFTIELCEDSARMVVSLWLVCGLCAGIYEAERKNYRHGAEHGSARWGNVQALCRRYRDRDFARNRIFTEHFFESLNVRKHERNLNAIVVGGSGAGKTQKYVIPNLMQGNSSFVVLDPKGEIVRSVGCLLREKGYEVRVLDLINMERSHGYNPFVYLKTDNDIQKLVTNLFKATTPKGSQSQDPFWDTSASMLLMALICYLHYEAPEEEQNFAMVMEMLRAGEVSEEDEQYHSALDLLFLELENREPYHIAVKYYRDYHSGSAKTLKSIQITLAARLEKFNLESMADLTSCDELDLPSLGERKVVLFALIPDNDTSFNFLVGILYTQIFQQLFYEADHMAGGELRQPVHFLMDEFANVSLPDDFEKILSVMRSRGISVSIILQNLAQLKALFDKQWESIIGNCDFMLYLGGNEKETHKYLSEQLGKETIDLTTYGKSSGRNGNYSTNYQITGRELLTPDEVRILDNRKSILLIRGERPLLDDKYDVTHHPDFAKTVRGGWEPYHHGLVTDARGTLQMQPDMALPPLEEPPAPVDYELLTEEEWQEQMEEKEKIHG